MNSLELGGGWSVEWAVADRALQEESGDLHVVAPFDGGVVVAVIDGLGHGPEAAHAARGAATVVTANAGAPLDSLLRGCHDALHHTRGVAMSVACFATADGSLSWSGIGNVEALLARADPAAPRARESLATRGGVLGFQIPTPHVSTLDVRSGDVLVFATDGIRSGFEATLDIRKEPRAAAKAILDAHRRETDDALVLFARFLSA
ncbi:MAG TPA: SpoIIE family protein phosphatase [Polyangiaceae bacterium]|nr:SpoIIE family protein phosphatase [Polyangiaceae bacterium]